MEDSKTKFVPQLQRDVSGAREGLRIDGPDVGITNGAIVLLHRCVKFGKFSRAIAIGCLALLSTSLASAQAFSIDWHTMDGGGGTSTGGVSSISGTIGQPDASPQKLTGGQFSLTGGFWARYAMPAPGARVLTITLTSTNTALEVADRAMCFDDSGLKSLTQPPPTWAGQGIHVSRAAGFILKSIIVKII